MRKNITAICAAALCLALLPGCWDYVSLDEVSIVAGIALDRDVDDPKLYRVTLELVDSDSAEKTQPKSIYMELTGKTIMDAMDKANQELQSNVYLGNAEIMVIHQDILQEDGLLKFMEALSRDYHTRETLLILISREKSANEILASQDKLVSYEIGNYADPMHLGTHSTRALEMYRIYDDLKRDASAVTLPALRLETQKKEKKPVMDGLGIFKKDKLIGYLEQESLPAFMFLREELEGGTYSFYMDIGEEKPVPVTIEIRKSKVKRSFEWDGEKLNLIADIKADCVLNNAWPNYPLDNNESLRKLEMWAAQDLKHKTVTMIDNVRQETGIDIFGFASDISRTNNKLWESLKPQWEEYFHNAEITINCSFHLLGTGLNQNY